MDLARRPQRAVHLPIAPLCQPRFRAARILLTCPKKLCRLRQCAANKELAGLGLSDEEEAVVLEVVAKTQATNVSESVNLLIAYAGSASTAGRLVRQHPNLLCCQLPSWIKFLTGLGLSSAQVQHVLCQAPEALVEGDLVRAGESMITFRRLGLNDYAAAQLATYYPQLLSKSDEEIRTMVNLLGRYQVSIDSSGC